MPKHRIGATSTMCNGAGHDWQASLAPNYRICRACRSVEMYVDGQWVSPSARRKSIEEATPVPTTVQTTTALHVQDVPLSPVVVRRRQIGDRLWVWGQKHCFPQLRVQLSDRIHTIVPGEAIWHIVCYQCPTHIIEAALEQYESHDGLIIDNEAERARREELLQYGRAREWKSFSHGFTLTISSGENEWYRFAAIGNYGQVCQVCDLLAQQEGAVQK